MADSSAPTVLVSSRRFRRLCLAWLVLVLPFTIAILILTFLTIAPFAALVTAALGLLVVYPAMMLRYRLAIDDDGFQPRWGRGSAGARVPWAKVDEIELRRGILLELIRVRAGRSQSLLAPVRLRYLSDPDFDAAVAELARRSGLQVRPAQPGRHARRIAALWVVFAVCMALLVAMQAPWNSRSWPWRHEAGSLPPCAGFATTARALFPISEETSSGDIFMLGMVGRQDGCTWRGGTVDTFSVGYGMTDKDLFDSAGTVAHDAFRRTVTAVRHPDRVARPVAGLGDEAQEITDRAEPGKVTAVDVVARRANVIVTVRLVTDPADPDASGTVERTARAALAEVKLS